MSKDFDESKLKEQLKQHAENISEDDLKKIVGEKSKLEEKLNRIPARFQKLVSQVKLLFELITDYWHGNYKKVPWYTVTMVAAAVAYVLSPIDAIPDFIPIVGHIDDAFIVAFVWKGIEEDLKNYCDFKGYSKENYF